MSEQVTHILRAMAVNYLRADVFDTLDSQALNKAADQIDALHAEADALRAENGRLTKDCSAEMFLTMTGEVTRLRTKLEAARGLLVADLQKLLPELDDALEDLELHGCHDQQGYRKLKDWFRKVEIQTRKLDAALSATQAPEVPDHLCDAAEMVEQGERREVWANFDSMELCMHKPASGDWVKVYTTPQPGPDVRGLAAFALELIDGAWEGGSFDGGDIQEAGVRHGLLTVEQRQESCGEHCDCAEYGFPSECYRLTPAMAAHRQAQQGGSHDT